MKKLPLCCNHGFFGLLFEFLGQPLDQRSFVRVSHRGTLIVNMASLDGLIATWITRIRGSSNYSNQQLLNRLNDFSKTAMSYISPKGSQLINGTTPLPYEVVLSVLLLADYLDIAKCHVQQQLNGCQRIPTIIPESMKSRLINENWCPADIEFLQANMQLTATYYLSLIGPPYPDLQHSQCTQQVCEANKTTEQSYRIRHIPANCRCTSWLQIDIQLLTGAISRDETLLVTVAPSPAGYQLIPSTTKPGVRYVAISHVWSQGLANPSWNALPACQGQNIQKLVNSMYPQRGNIPFWLDTLSIPTAGTVERELRNTALKNMERVYLNADKVLVIETSLLSVSSRIPDFELVARLAMSAWLRRIWTLQEAVKAKELYFQFSDGMLSLQQILQKVPTCQSHKTFRPEQTLMYEFLRPFYGMKELGDSGGPSSGSDVDALSKALTAIQFRETKYPTDVVRAVSSVVDQKRDQLPVPVATTSTVPSSAYTVAAQRQPDEMSLRPRPAESARWGSKTALVGTVLGLATGYAALRAAKYIQRSQESSVSQATQTAAAVPSRPRLASTTTNTTPPVPYRPVPPRPTIASTSLLSSSNFDDVQTFLLRQQTVAANLLFKKVPK